MLLLFSIMTAEWPPVWERVVHSVYCAFLSSAFINLYLLFSLLVLREECGIWFY